jgi:hypothetical protein
MHLKQLLCSIQKIACDCGSMKQMLKHAASTNKFSPSAAALILESACPPYPITSRHDAAAIGGADAVGASTFHSP